MPSRLNTDIEGFVVDVLTREAQSKLRPLEVLDALREGNDRFVAGEVTLRNHKAQVRTAAKGQFPKAVVLSCLDSRVPVEDVFDRGIGDIFVARIAGNFVNDDVLGSMEFACKIAGAKLILVMGHEYCGAIMGAIDQVKLGHLTGLLEKIEPAVDATLNDHPHYRPLRSSKNPDLVQLVARRNVNMTVEKIRHQSSVLQAMENAQAIAIVGAMYDMETGRVAFHV